MIDFERLGAERRRSGFHSPPITLRCFDSGDMSGSHLRRLGNDGPITTRELQAPEFPGSVQGDVHEHPSGLGAHALSPRSPSSNRAGGPLYRHFGRMPGEIARSPTTLDSWSLGIKSKINCHHKHKKNMPMSSSGVDVPQCVDGVDESPIDGILQLWAIPNRGSQPFWVQ